MPKVSVIIPVYNVEPYLPRCLDSVINQTLEDIEILCINDCSTDGSLAILQDYASKDKRIKLIDLPQNLGAGEAKNKGLEIAQGKYVGFVDPDDYIDLNFYEELYKKAKETNADIVKTDLTVIEVDGYRRKNNLNDRIKLSRLSFSFDYTSAIYKSSVIFDNNILFPTELIVGEDDVFLNRIVIKSKTVEVIDNVNYYYVRRHNSLNTYEYDEKRIYSNFRAIECIAENYNNALNKEISENMYIDHYWINVFALINYAISKTSSKSLKLKCAEKFIELYNKCKLRDKMDAMILAKYKKIYPLIQEKKYEKLVDICIEYKNLQNYCLIEQLRNKVKKDIINAKSINSNTCI